MATLHEDERQRLKRIEEITKKVQQKVKEAIEKQQARKLHYEKLDLKIQALQEEVQRIKKEQGIE